MKLAERRATNPYSLFSGSKVPYETKTGRHELASRTAHGNAAVRAIAERASFYVPAENVSDTSWLVSKIRNRTDVARPEASARLRSALAIDGSRVVVPVRDGLPSVRYGYAQASAAYLDLDALEGQRAERFVDPAALHRAANTALVSLDLPTAGAYTRAGVSIQDSWREAIDAIFRSKRIQVNGLDLALMDLLFVLHGTPGAPAGAVPVNCPSTECGARAIPVPKDGADCPRCSGRVLPTDTLRISEEVVEDGTNEDALGRLMQVIELLVLVGLTKLLWEQARDDLLVRTLFIMDGPLAMYGPPAKLRAQALRYFQAMAASTDGRGPHICGLEKTGALVDYARALCMNDVLAPGEALIVDSDVLRAANNSSNPIGYGSETYWGRKFIYRAMDGRVVVPTVPPHSGPPYDDQGGQPDVTAYPTLGRIFDVIDRTGSTMYRDGVIPVALAHGRAAFPIGVGTDVLRLVARQVLGLDGAVDDR